MCGQAKNDREVDEDKVWVRENRKMMGRRSWRRMRCGRGRHHVRWRVLFQFHGSCLILKRSVGFPGFGP
ncbi:hypothetical protein D5086_025043 [Populus alba]|uniref:Uncharacterized protein n=1 Tax=Populus alba TaxID=43335 RepID=A0ACC4B770_POPAL